MTWQTWWLFTVTEAVLCLTPGPAVLLVVAEGLRRGPVRAAWSSAGILVANLGYFALSATGLGALLVTSVTLFTFVKWLGSAYLIYLGLGALLRRSSLLAVSESDGAARPGRGFLNAFLVQAANPKALLFFVAILPQFVDPSGSVPFQIAVYGVTSTLLEAGILLGYGCLAGRASLLAMRPAFAAWTDRIGGGLLLGAGLGLARQSHAG